MCRYPFWLMAVTIMNTILQVVVLVQHNLNIDVELNP